MYIVCAQYCHRVCSLNALVPTAVCTRGESSGAGPAVVAGTKRPREETEGDEEDMYGGSTDEGEDMDTDVGWWKKFNLSFLTVVLVYMYMYMYSPEQSCIIYHDKCRDNNKQGNTMQYNTTKSETTELPEVRLEPTTLLSRQVLCQ